MRQRNAGTVDMYSCTAAVARLDVVFCKKREGLDATTYIRVLSQVRTCSWSGQRAREWT